MSCNCWTAMLSIVLALILTWAWKNSARAKAYIKLVTFALSSILMATLPIPLMLFRPRSPKNALIPAAGLRLLAKYVLGLKFSVKGKEHLVKNSGAVVVINHQSAIDLIVLAELWPILENATVISKKEIFYIWPFGLAAWLWGTIYIDRLNGAKAKDSINSTGEIIRSRQAKVLMFPEGTRSFAEKLLPFKKGAFCLAIASKCPVQPVVVTRYTFLHNNRFDEGEVEISILPPISTEQFGFDDVPKLVDQCYSAMQTVLESNCAKEKKNIGNNNDIGRKNGFHAD